LQKKKKTGETRAKRTKSCAKRNTKSRQERAMFRTKEHQPEAREKKENIPMKERVYGKRAPSGTDVRERNKVGGNSLHFEVKREGTDSDERGAWQGGYPDLEIIRGKVLDSEVRGL